MDIINGIGGWPVLLGDEWKEKEFNWLNTVKYFEDAGFSALDKFLELDFGVDYRNNTRNIINVSNS